MIRLIIGVVAIIIFIGLYTFFAGSGDKNTATKSVKSSENLEKEPKIKVVDSSFKKRKSEKSKERDDKKEDDKIITNSKVLQGLYKNIKKDDWDAFDEIYHAQIKLLRDGKEHTEFYEDFKDFFKNNRLDRSTQIGVLGLLTDTATTESIATLFEMFDEGIIDDEVNYPVGEYLARSSNWIKGDLDVDMRSLIKAITKAYKTTDNHYLKKAVAELLGDYETIDNDVMLFHDYISADTPTKKRAAYTGLMSINSNKLLPNLRTYLASSNQDVKETAGMVLSNMVTDDAIEVFSDWIITDSKIEDMPNIKKWLSKVMKRVGVSRVRKTINIDKIRSQEFRIELEDFFDEEQEREKASVSSN